MRLNYPLCLTGCHRYTNTLSSRQPGKITSIGPRVFFSLPPPSCLSNHLSAPTVRIKTNPQVIFFLFKETNADYEGSETENIQLTCVWGKVLIVRQTDVHVFCVLVPMWVLCPQLGNPNSIYSVLCSELFQSHGISELMYSAYFMCVYVCELVKAHCSQVNVWWGNEALDKWNKNSRCSPSVPCDSSRQTLASVFLKANTHII